MVYCQAGFENYSTGFKKFQQKDPVALIFLKDGMGIPALLLAAMLLYLPAFPLTGGLPFREGIKEKRKPQHHASVLKQRCGGCSQTEPSITD